MCRAGIGHYETLAASIAVMFVAFLLGIISCKLLGSMALLYAVFGIALSCSDLLHALFTDEVMG